jgi:hypothetical protein
MPELSLQATTLFIQTVEAVRRAKPLGTSEQQLDLFGWQTPDSDDIHVALSISPGGLRTMTDEETLQELERAGLIKLRRQQAVWFFFITTAGLDYYDQHLRLPRIAE